MNKEDYNKCTDFDEVFSKTHLYLSAHKCFKGEGWKASVQLYRNEVALNVLETWEALQNDTYVPKPFNEFTLIERGKARDIQAVFIADRVVQKCLCDYSLYPILVEGLIHDNGACLKGKGLSFTINRMKAHLHRYFNNYGNEGYVLKIDFSKYFNNIDHDILKAILVDKYKNSPDILNLLYTIIDMSGLKGLGLGSQISQICALTLPSGMDHYLKEQMHFKYYGRYMDDGYIICNDKEKLQEALNEITRMCNEKKIILNPKKTQIIKLSKGIPFLKRRFILTETGAVKQIPNKESITKMRHKLKSLREKVDTGERTLESVFQSYISWKGHMEDMNAFFTERNMDEYFIQLFPELRDDLKGYEAKRKAKKRKAHEKQVAEDAKRKNKNINQ